MIACPLCGAKTRVTETRVTATNARRRRSRVAPECSGKVTTVEIVVREGHAFPFAKGCVVVPAKQIAKLREIVATLEEGEL